MSRFSSNKCHQGTRSVHEYTTKFMRLAERNDLRESEGQQAIKYLERLKQQIKDKIGVQAMRNLHEAKNMDKSRVHDTRPRKI